MLARMINLLVLISSLCFAGGAPVDDSCVSRLTGWRALPARARQSVLSSFGVMREPSPAIADTLRRRLRLRADQFVIPPELVSAWANEFGLSREELMVHFLPFVSETARPPSSEYMVGNLGLTAGGHLIIGNNLEFPPLPHVFSVHGETFLITLAYLRGLGPIRAIALKNGKACGHCRQFMVETTESKRMKIIVPGRRATPLPRYVPDAFDPIELGVAGLLLTPQSHAVDAAAVTSDPLDARAVAEARRAYAPYSSRPAGVAFRTRDGRVFGGPYLEIVNYNASLDPAAAAMIDLASHGVAYAEVTEVVLAELPSVNPDKDITFADTSRLIAAARLPNARFRRIELRRRP